MLPIRVLLIGAGTMARMHGQALGRTPLAEVVGVVNERSASARRLARELGTRAFGDLVEAARRTAAQAVFVCLPTPLHHRAVLTAARAGLHVFCEKPIARSERDAEAMVRACEKAGVVFMVGHVLRHFPAYAKLHELVAQGAIGKPAMARLSRGGGAPRGSRDWYAERRASGGVLLDLVIHDFDWLRWTFGPVERVHARATGAARGQVASYALAVLRHRSGVISHVEGFWGHELPFRTTVEVAGDEGALEFDSASPVALALHRDAGTSRAPVLLPESPVDPTPYELQAAQFVDCVRRSSTPPASARDAMEALRIGLACLSSSRTGGIVCL